MSFMRKILDALNINHQKNNTQSKEMSAYELERFARECNAYVEREDRKDQNAENKSKNQVYHVKTAIEQPKQQVNSNIKELSFQETKPTTTPKIEVIIRKDIVIDGLDYYFVNAGRSVIEKDKASIGMIQRIFKIGFNRASLIIDQLAEAGVVGEEIGTAPRKILMTAEEFESLIENYRPINKAERRQSNYSAENRVNLYNNQFDNMEGHDFEYFCADLLRKNGFSDVKVTQGSGDQGIDVLATKDGIKYGVQCKCYSSDIGNKAVQEVFSGKTFYNCHVGVVLTNRYFTASAKELAEKNGVLLWDRDKLNELISEV